jgi:hypothetical protein
MTVGDCLPGVGGVNLSPKPEAPIPKSPIHCPSCPLSSRAKTFLARNRMVTVPAPSHPIFAP